MNKKKQKNFIHGDGPTAAMRRPEPRQPFRHSAKAELRATGLDALIRRANAVPELKIAAPVLIFLKGIARQDGNESVWAISYVDRKMVVNDTDLSGLMPVK